MILSGLNLAVTAVGFGVLNKKLEKLEVKLNEMQRKVEGILIFLELKERYELAAALRNLLISVDTKDMNRHDLLFSAKNVLAPISLKYRELLAETATIETAMACEEYFCLTSLAHARCLAELGMLEVARRDLEEANEFWNGQARRITKELLLAKNPERFLFSDFSQDVPVFVLVEWLDFVYEEEKGFGWIDELRSKTKPWYSHDSFWKKINTSNGNGKTKILQQEKVIPSLQKLVSRNNVLNGFVAQYKLLEEHNVTPSEFEKKVALLAPTAPVDGYIILQPAESKRPNKPWF